jgi:hypothetical protein
MLHKIPSSTVPPGSGVLAVNYARANCARDDHEADTFATMSIGQMFGALRQGTFGLPFYSTYSTENRGAALPLVAHSVARSIINDNAYANRCAAPGRNPGSRRHWKPD